MSTHTLELGKPEETPDLENWDKEDRQPPSLFEWRVLFGALRRHGRTALAVMLLVVGAATLYLIFATPYYAGASSILIDPRLGRGPSIDPTRPDENVTDSVAIDSQVKLLTSQKILTRVIRSLDLQHDPEFELKPGFLGALFADAPREASKESLMPVLKELSEAIAVKRVDRTYLVEIQAISADPVKAANIANAIVQAYLDDKVEARTGASSNDLQHVREQMDSLQKQIQSAENKVETYKSQNHIVMSEGLASNEQQISDLTKELGFARGRASEAKAKYDQIRNEARANPSGTQSEVLTSPTIEALRKTQAETQREVSKLMNTLGPRHPAFVEAQAADANVKRLIANEMHRIEARAADDYAAEHANLLQLEASIDQLKAQSNSTSVKLVPLRQLEREVESLRGAYGRFAKI